MKDVQGKFIVLRKMPFRESDLIIHALSETGSKKSFIAKGGLRSKKRFGGGVLEPTHHVLLHYRQNERGDGTGMNVLLEAELLNDFPLIRKDYDRLEMGLHFMKVASTLGLEGDTGSQAFYFLVGHVLKSLELVKDLETLKFHFYVKFLRQQGVLPEADWVEVFTQKSVHESDSLSHIRRDHMDEVIRLYQIADDYLKTAESHQSFLSPRG